VTRRPVFSPEARTDLRQLDLHIAGQSGDARALAYIGRLLPWLHRVP
jgi:hypothetical protein